MTLKFPPLSDEECLMLLPEGNYEFYVRKAEMHTSQNTGNQSIKVTLDIAQDHGVVFTLFDYLTPAFKMKFKHFCASTGLMDKYDSGELSPEDCIGKWGVAKVKRNTGDEKYDPKNEIKDYVKPELEAASAPASTPFEDSDIPI